MYSLLLVPVALAFSAPPANDVHLDIEDQRTTIRTPSVTVVFGGPAIASIRGPEGVEFAHGDPPANAVDLYYFNGQAFGQDKHQTVSVRKLSSLAARIVVDGADTKRSLLVAADPDTGDVLVTPDGISRRRGVRSVGMKLAVHGETELILPVINGLRIRQGAEQPPGGRWPWPFEWNAQLLIARRGDACLMIHSEDTTQQFKALQFHRRPEHHELVLETESPGPFWDNRTAGGVTWRINAYRGDWRVPAGRYRDWMHRTYDLAEKRGHRPPWADNITLAMSWANPNEAMLDALAAVHPPEETIIHLSNWRTDRYDLNYPEYTAREEVLRYMEKAAAMGFHVMPHFNYFAVYYRHPLFVEIADFQIRSPDRNEPQGWHWPPETHDYTRMGYIHPGLGLWRSTLIDAVLAACEQTGARMAFLDQTLCTWNTDNAIVQGRNTIGGMQLLQEDLSAVRPDLVLVGEGLTEISFQRQAFAQAHIYDGWRHLVDWHPDLMVPICAFLWGEHCRLFGYYHLSPGQPTFELGIEVYERMGALPTLITNNPQDLREMSPGTRRVLEQARRWRGTAATQPG
jgi:hypothetical protein